MSESASLVFKNRATVMKIASYDLKVVEPFMMPKSTLGGGVGRDASPEKLKGRLQAQSDYVNQVSVSRHTRAYCYFATSKSLFPTSSHQLLTRIGTKDSPPSDQFRLMYQVYDDIIITFFSSCTTVLLAYCSV